MSLDKIKSSLRVSLEQMREEGRMKGREDVIVGVQRAGGGLGPRYFLKGKDGQEFIRMNSNAYLGMPLRRELIEAEESYAEKYGTGPGAVRFINGTFESHVELERRLAEFHGKESAIIFSSAYAAVCGVISSLITKETAFVSDSLNHNCIINSAKLAKPCAKIIYEHLDMENLDRQLEELRGKCRRVIVVTDGVFSMRGDYPDLKQLVRVVKKHDQFFDEGVISVVDDSHGVGAYGETGRGTCEMTGEYDVDIVLATLGKALGVNGGYAVTDAKVVEYLRETAPTYIYSNPITPAEAGAAIKAIDILDSGKGREMMAYLCEMTSRFREGIVKLGYETIDGRHPVVPLMVRDSGETIKIVDYLKSNGVLVVGLKFPVVPRGDECLRFQISCDHTPADIDHVLDLLATYKK